MKIKYHISEDTYKNVIQTVTRKLKYYNEGAVQLLAVTFWIWYYLLLKDEYQFLWILITGMAVGWVITALFVHYLFYTLQPKMYIRLVVRKNQNAIGDVLFELQDEYIQLVSNDDTTLYKRNMILRVKELDTAYCLIIPRNIYIVIPKNSGLSDGNEQEYTDRLATMIEELKQTARYQRLTNN